MAVADLGLGLDQPIAGCHRVFEEAAGGCYAAIDIIADVLGELVEPVVLSAGFEDGIGLRHR
jgi:hypothetical protein